MPKRQGRSTVNIRPGVSVLSVLRHLNYKPWFALAEFVDNSLQSYLSNRERLPGQDCVTVDIRIDPSGEGRITIRDDAAGIALRDYDRAFRPAEVPLDRAGLSEFGMGMKSAACWFAPQWQVRSSAINETVERLVSFDIATIVRDSLEELHVEESQARPGDHFTEVVLSPLFKAPQTKTLGKIQGHLRSIYRNFLRDGRLRLFLDGEELSYEAPAVLVAPWYKTPDAPPVKWLKEIDFDFGGGLRVRGFAALREVASTAQAGFALFRRDRLIEGSADEGYRPEQIFGRSNSYRFQRLFGELHLDGFAVSHTKDGFAWEEHETVFLDILREELDREPLRLLAQAEEYRVRGRTREGGQNVEQAAATTATIIERDLPPAIAELEHAAPVEAAPPAPQPVVVPSVTRRLFPLTLDGRVWQVVLEIVDDPALGDFIELWDARTATPQPEGSAGVVGVRLSLAHPFVLRFAGRDFAEIEGFLRLAAALGLSEVAATDSGVRHAGTIRRNLNKLLRSGLANPR